jgi:hypothetical protein
MHIGRMVAKTLLQNADRPSEHRFIWIPKSRGLPTISGQPCKSWLSGSRPTRVGRDGDQKFTARRSLVCLSRLAQAFCDALLVQSR